MFKRLNFATRFGSIPMEKYYTRKEVTCEYNILVDILYVWKDEDSWTQVESDIQILALPGKEMR